MRELNHSITSRVSRPTVESEPAPQRQSPPARSSVSRILARIQHSPAESLILQTIAALANVTGHNARISFVALAMAVGLSERWTRELVQRLEARNLLRVHRHRISYKHCAINVYDIVIPWRRDLTYTEAFAAKQAHAQMSRDVRHPGHFTKEKNPLADALAQEKIRKNQGCEHPQDGLIRPGPEVIICTKCWVELPPPAEDTKMAN